MRNSLAKWARWPILTTRRIPLAGQFRRSRLGRRLRRDSDVRKVEKEVASLTEDETEVPTESLRGSVNAVGPI